MNMHKCIYSVVPLLTLVAVFMVVDTSPVLGQHDGHDHDGHDHDDHISDVEHAPPHADEDGHPSHDDHQRHDGHDDHDEGLHISADTLSEFGIEVQTAAPGSLDTRLQLTGQVVFNADRIAHVMPNVSGIVQSVNRSVGDRVEAGDVMAVLRSRDLASARSMYLAAWARLELANELLSRDERLVADRIGTERQLLESQQTRREAEIELNLAEHNLHALGEDHDSIQALPETDDTNFAEYLMRAPIDGIVIERHLTHGELVSDQTDEPPLVIADVSSVWVNLTVYQRDLAHIRAGQSVRIEFGHNIPDATGTLAFISPAFDEKTRTATARVVLENPEGHWRPGLFVTAHVSTDQSVASVLVPRSAITEYEGDTVVFKQHEEGFEPCKVQTGRSSEHYIEIVSGLEPGDRYVARNTLALKAELNRAELEHAGHVH